MASENETVAEIAKQMRRNEEVFHHLYWCEYADRIEAAHGREVAELRECLKEAITEYCTSRPHEFDDGFGNCENFKNGSCAGSECWRLDCINKWRKALEGAKDEGK